MNRLYAKSAPVTAQRQRLFSLSFIQQIIFLSTLILSATTIIAAQGATTLGGTTNDENGAHIAGASLILRAREGSLRQQTLSDENGKYEFARVPSGNYLLEVSAAGFVTYASESFQLADGENLTRDVTLRAAGVNGYVLVTPNGTTQNADEIGKASTVLTANEINVRGETRLSETLRATPGLRVQQQGSPGALTSLRFRGGRNFDTAILLDGLRVRDASDINGSAAPFFSDFLPANLERVEILRGSGSSLYGTNAIGGAINLVPQTGTGKPHFAFGFDGGGLRQFRELFEGAGGITSRGGYSFNVTRYDVRRGVDGNDEYGNTAGGGRITFALTPTAVLSGNFYGTTSNFRVNDSPFALPGAFASNAQFPRAVAGQSFQPDYNNPDEGRRNRAYVASIRLAQQVNEIFSYTVAYQRVSTNRRNYNGANIDPRFAAFYPFGDFEFQSINRGTTDTFDARANLQLGRYNLATFGFEYERESLFQSSQPSFSAFNNTTDRQRTLAVFAQDQLFAFERRLQISVAARGQFYRVQAADRPGTLNNTEPDSTLTGDGSIAYFVRASNTKLRAHVGNGFRAASLFERFGNGTLNGAPTRFGDPTLKAEQSVSVDGGFDQRLLNDRLSFGATYFYTEIQRSIAFTGFAFDPLGFGRFSGYANRPGGIARGLETYFEAAPARGANVRANYTFTNSDRRTAASGSFAEYVVPRHIFNFGYTQRFLRAYTLNFELNRTGSYIAPVFENDFPFRTANLQFDRYTKADIYLNYERALNERVHLTLFGGVDNLFNREYFESGFRAPKAVGRGGFKLGF